MPLTPSARADRRAALAARDRRRLLLAVLFCEAAAGLPGASQEQIIAEAVRLGSRFGDTSAWPDPAEFAEITGLTLAQLTAPTPQW